MKLHTTFATFIFAPALIATNAYSSGSHDPLITMVSLKHLEWQDFDEGTDNHADKDAIALKAEAWTGYDFNKLWLKLESEHVDSDTEELELQLLYSRAISSYWDLQAGIRSDFEPSPTTNWGVIGLQGLAPYFFEIETALFVGDEGKTAFRFSAEYDLLFTQKLILSPEIEINAYGQNEPDYHRGSGLSDVQFDLRLRYEFVREFAPYIGFSWEKYYGNTADYFKQDGEEEEIKALTLGIRAWF